MLNLVPDILPSLKNYQNPPLTYPLQNISLLQIWANLTDDRSLLVIFMQWSTSWHENRVVNTHREIGRSRPNFPTVSISATFGSRNRISARMSTDRLRNKEWVKFRAAASDFCWYIKAVSARGTDDKASV